jgi:hypothetical protein
MPSAELRTVDRGISLNRMGAGEPPGETAPPPGILDRVPDDIRRQRKRQPRCIRRHLTRPSLNGRSLWRPEPSRRRASDAALGGCACADPRCAYGGGFEGRGDLTAVEGALKHWSQVVVAQDVELSDDSSSEESSSSGLSMHTAIKATGPELGGRLEAGSGERAGTRSSVRQRGSLRYRVHFGAVADYMRRAVEAHPARRVWLIFDEWSGVQPALQPYLAEMLRRLFFGSPKVVTRIAAIPHRTVWRISQGTGADGYIGVETGSEIFALLDLDDFVVFPARSRDEQTRKSTVSSRVS